MKYLVYCTPFPPSYLVRQILIFFILHFKAGETKTQKEVSSLLRVTKLTSGKG